MDKNVVYKIKNEVSTKLKEIDNSIKDIEDESALQKGYESLYKALSYNTDIHGKSLLINELEVQLEEKKKTTRADTIRLKAMLNQIEKEIKYIESQENEDDEVVIN